MLLRHYLEQGLSKAAVAARLAFFGTPLWDASALVLALLVFRYV